MAQQPVFDVGSAAERIDQRAVARARHGVDCEVAARQIRFERYIRSEFHGEAAVAGCALAFGAGERVLLVRGRMQKDREVAADLLVALGGHLGGSCADHDPVAFRDRPAEQLVPNSAAYQIHLHRQILTEMALPETAPPRPANRRPQRTSEAGWMRRVRWLSGAVVSLALAGCYVLQAARGQAAILIKREPIDRVVARTKTAADVRARLEQALVIREYASRELGLPRNRSYTTYADIGRPYVVWNVFAAPEFSVEPMLWCFPIAGCVPYRGYFSESAAQRSAHRLRHQGLDVHLGGATAYSTLGHFADPVLSTMIRFDDVNLAGVIFHELAPQRVYVPGDSSFNEAFATAVEQEGLKRWLISLDRRADLERYVQRQRHFIAVNA